jgi:hypothetical protein
MNIGRCLEILELKSAESLDEVRKAYKILVKVWHPDRFSHDPHLKRKAEDKIQKINAAYEGLKCFFNDKCYKFDPKYAAGEELGTNVHWQRNRNDRPKNDSETTPSQVPPATPTGRRTPAVTARSSSLGKYVFFGFLIGMAVFTALVLHFLSRMDSSIRNLPQVALETIEEKLKDFDAPAPPPEPVEKEPGKDTLGVRPVVTDGEPSVTPRTKTPCIIHLHSGDYIIAEAWWYNDDMVEYRVKHGIVGIERKRVKDIRCQ